jgi:hypothetical protein
MLYEICVIIEYMNIFFLSICVRRCAKYHFNKHMKMILELCQLLCTAWHMLDADKASQLLEQSLIYRKTHYNHSCAIWTRAHINNYKYVARLGLALCDEWRFRYNHPSTKKHKCEEILKFLLTNFPPSINSAPIEKTIKNPLGFTLPMPQAMPDECKVIKCEPSVSSCIRAYRQYYKSSHKEKLVLWTYKDKNTNERINIPKPHWW